MSNKKIKGFAIKRVDSFSQIKIKRKLICYIKHPSSGLFLFYSYSKYGFKIVLEADDLASGIALAIQKANKKPKLIG